MNLKKDVLPLLQETLQEFQKDEAGQLGAALAYYATFSIFPLLLLLLAGLGFVLNYWPVAIDSQAQILAVISQNFSPQLSATVEQILAVLKEQAGAATGIGLVVLLLGASGVFQQLDTSFKRIWKVPEKPQATGILATVISVLHDKLFSFGMVLAVGFLMLISLALTGISQALLGVLGDLPVIGGIFGYAAGLLITVGLSTLIFALLFRYLPGATVRWGDVWLGALITAIVWEIAKRLLGLYIGRSSYASAYGAVGTVLVLMAWVYFSSQVLFLGAEFTEVYSRRYGSRAPAPTPQPEVEPAPAPPVPAPAPASAPGHSTVTVAAATGAGLLVGVLGSLIAIVAALIIGARRAASSVARLVPRHK
ncbi:MAG: YihY/virulence factor BrkB family protein [Roseiflexaceae bacterium]